MRRRDEHRHPGACSGVRLGEELRRSGHRPRPGSHLDQPSHQRAHHVMAERVGAKVDRDHRVLVPVDLELVQGADRRRPVTRLAEGEEVMEPLRLTRGLGHRLGVELPLVPRRHRRQERVDERPVVGQPVLVGAPQGGEAGVEVLGHLGHRVDDEVVVVADRQHSPQATEQRGLTGPVRAGDELLHRRGGQVDVDDLPPGVDAGVGATGDDGRHLLAGDPGQALLQSRLHGAQMRLLRPTVEVGALIAEVDAESRHGPTVPLTSKTSRGLNTVLNSRDRNRRRCRW